MSFLYILKKTKRMYNRKKNEKINDTKNFQHTPLYFSHSLAFLIIQSSEVLTFYDLLRTLDF